jgi:hypothetical protein
VKTVSISNDRGSINVRIPDQISECDAFDYVYMLAKKETNQLGINGVRHRRTLRRIEKALGYVHSEWGKA